MADGESYHLLADVQNPTTDVVVIPFRQFAKIRPNRPGTPAVVSGSVTSSQELYPVTLSATDQLYVRFGLAAKLAASSQESFGRAFASLTIMRAVQAMSLGRLDLSLTPGPAGKALAVPIGPRRPTVGMTALKMAVMIQSMAGTGDLDNQFAARLYGDDPESPGTWAGLESGFHTATGDVERLVSEIDTANITDFSDSAWFQPGIMFEPSTADVYATVKAHVVGVR